MQDDVAICMQLVMIAMSTLPPSLPGPAPRNFKVAPLPCAGTFFESSKYARFSQQPISSGPLPLNQN